MHALIFSVLCLTLTGCGIVDDLSDTAHAQAERLTGGDGARTVCRTTVTFGLNTDSSTGSIDTTQVCEAGR